MSLVTLTVRQLRKLLELICEQNSLAKGKLMRESEWKGEFRSKPKADEADELEQEWTDRIAPAQTDIQAEAKSIGEILEDLKQREKESVDQFQDRISALIANGPTLKAPHDAPALIQCVRSHMADPAGTTGELIARHFGTVMIWIRHHAAAAERLNNVERQEYFRQLLIERQRIAKEGK